MKLTEVASKVPEGQYLGGLWYLFTFFSFEFSLTQKPVTIKPFL